MTHRKQRYRNTSTSLRARFITSTAPPPGPSEPLLCCSHRGCKCCSGPPNPDSGLQARLRFPPLPSGPHRAQGPTSLHTWTPALVLPSGSVLWPQNLQVDSTTHFPGLSHHSGTPATHRCGRAMLAFFLSPCTKCFEAELDRVRDRGWPARCC